jgi:hypothetical protein
MFKRKNSSAPAQSVDQQIAQAESARRQNLAREYSVINGRKGEVYENTEWVKASARRGRR